MCVLLYIFSVCIYSFTSIYIFVIFTATLKKSTEHVSLSKSGDNGGNKNEIYRNRKVILKKRKKIFGTR